jgi:hypothetical protein
MIKALILAVYMAFPVMEHSEDGQFVRIYNGTPDPFYCWIVLDNGRNIGRILYAGQATPWRYRYQIIDWGCE